MILFGIFIVFLMLAVLKGGLIQEHQSDSALEILKKRYAAGDINKEEFDRKRHEIQA